MIDRLQSTRCVLLCSWFFCTHHGVFWPSDSIPPFLIETYTPLSGGTPAYAGTLRRVRRPSGEAEVLRMRRSSPGGDGTDMV